MGSDTALREPPRADAQSQPSTSQAASLALGWCAMTPIFAAYEVALAVTPGLSRNTCELLFSAPLAWFEPHVDRARWIVLGLCSLIALCVVRWRGASALAGSARVALEGVAGALALGPALVGLGWLLDGWLPNPALVWSVPASAPPLGVAALVFGAGAWEELLFRVGLLSILYLLGLRAAQAFLGEGRSPRALAECFALVGSALFFALFHLEAFTGWLGAGGEVFDAGLFTWRTLAGLLLGVLFRWRGPGVAAWTHGLFNVALLIGIGPDVLL